MITEAVALELMLAALRLGRMAVKQIGLMDLESLPPEVRTQLIQERDELNTDLARLNRLGKASS